MKLHTFSVIFVSLVLSVFAALALSVSGISNLLDQEARKVAEGAESIRLAQSLKSRLLTHNRDTFLYALERAPYLEENRRILRTEIARLIESLRQLAASSEQEAELVLTAEIEIASYLNNQASLDDLDLDPIEQYRQISRYVDDTMMSMDAVIEFNRQRMESLIATIQYQNRLAHYMAAGLLVLGGLILLGVVVVLVARVTSPLSRLSRIMTSYGEGDPKVRAEPRGLQEIREISQNFNAIADRLDEKREEQLRIIAGIAHDLRNPLFAILMALQTLLLKTREEDRDFVELIVREVKNLDRLVGDLLVTSQIEAGNLDLEWDDYDIREIITDIVELHKNASRKHELLPDLPDSPLICRCDARRLSQVINNLVSNAIKYSPKGGQVRVSGRIADEQLIVSVSDQGIGVAETDYERIFKPFNRTVDTRGRFPGVGLGLSSSKRIIEAHGGNLQVESSPGAGSTFHIVLPLHP